jgi:hypothetical protein
MAYTEGDRARFWVEFKDAVTCVLEDPTGVEFLLEDPRGVVVRYIYMTDVQLVKDSLGKYHVDHTLNQGTFWEWRWEATGTLIAATQGRINVEPARVV